MSLNQYMQKIDRYLLKDECLPLIVDVQNDEEQRALVQHYNVGETVLLTASNYCAQDEMPRLDTLLNDMTSKKAVMVVTGVTTFLKLEGAQALQRFLRQLLTMCIPGHVLFITYQCKQFLPVSDIRLGRQILVINGAEKKVPDIVFTAPGISLPESSASIQGLENFAEVAQVDFADAIYVITKKKKSAFPKALYCLSSIENAYDALIRKDPVTRILPKSLGTEAEWSYALQLFKNKSSWADVIDENFGGPNMLEHVLSNYENFSTDRRWLYFVALKLYGAKGNWCLMTAAQLASDMDDFTKQVYYCLLDKSIEDEDFWECYESRKNVLREIGITGPELTSYCKVVFIKGIYTICYLTDNTQKEQETIFAFLDQYGLEIEKTKLMEILKKVYPALYEYLLPYDFKNDLLNQYFQDYKYQKVINKLLPEFVVKVEKQAQERAYNHLLHPRSSVIEQLDKKDAQLYFMDAMGVEYLHYILSVCKELHLLADIKVCVAELPSITSQNKEFLDSFSDSGHPIISIKDIDDIKHHGKYDYDFYKNSKLPIYLSKELEVIRNVLVKIKNDLSEGKMKRAFLIADHGASRLAVLHDTENVWEMSEKGQHSGRCCPKSDVDERPAFAADAGNFWALANYDRFKGGRKANVEVHGGATLEELCVPVIELTYLTAKPEILLMSVEKQETRLHETPIIAVSFRKKAALKIFSSIPLKNVSVVINGNSYSAEDCDGRFYRVELPELKKSNIYYADVYAGDNEIAEHLPFIIQKEGQQERNLL